MAALIELCRGPGAVCEQDTLPSTCWFRVKEGKLEHGQRLRGPWCALVVPGGVVLWGPGLEKCVFQAQVEERQESPELDKRVARCLQVGGEELAHGKQAEGEGADEAEGLYIVWRHLVEG